MNVLYDTSALIALFIEAHPYHKDADTTHLTFSNTDAQIYTCAHSIAEVFSTLTAGKAYLKFSASEAKELIDYNIIPNFTTVELDTKDYLTTLEYLAEYNLTSGIVYDGIIAHASSIIEADYIITFNDRDFKRLDGLTAADFINPALR